MASAWCTRRANLSLLSNPRETVVAVNPNRVTVSRMTVGIFWHRQPGDGPVLF
jgi:hypothetical protein